MNAKCEICGSKFITYPSRVKYGNGRTCSIKCGAVIKRGNRISNKYKIFGDICTINLGGGHETIIESIDKNKVIGHKWRMHGGYCVSMGGMVDWSKRKSITLHGIILGNIKGKIIDHINRNKLDNRRSNLRHCNSSQNSINRARKGNKYSRYHGVYFNEFHNKWYAYICKNGVRTKSEFMNTEIDAAKRYNAYAESIHGEFAIFNKITAE